MPQLCGGFSAAARLQYSEDHLEQVIRHGQGPVGGPAFLPPVNVRTNMNPESPTVIDLTNSPTVPTNYPPVIDLTNPLPVIDLTNYPPVIGLTNYPPVIDLTNPLPVNDLINPPPVIDLTDSPLVIDLTRGPTRPNAAGHQDEEPLATPTQENHQLLRIAAEDRDVMRESMRRDRERFRDREMAEFDRLDHRGNEHQQYHISTSYGSDIVDPGPRMERMTEERRP
ncbi:hypothetical protein QBC34DRAFT_386886 [Podospora aff. communis PSN243]|uniref:Uncharacterized protein n=1 Tax=Podospora aff. communis PSN243 TaxID=3040156 RepID=A0AAV9G6E6_9PEZI|nr:hypothetical protein QBC34DRAFT_386886 [Podospora aff. communis PSN243]